MVEQRVSIVHKAEEGNQRPFYPSELSGLVGLGPLLIFAGRLRWPLSISYQIRATHI